MKAPPPIPPPSGFGPSIYYHDNPFYGYWTIVLVIASPAIFSACLALLAYFFF